MSGRRFCPKKIALWGVLAALSFSPIGGFALQPSVKETLLLRRISEYWEQANYGAAKEQLLDFLEKYPNTPLKDQLYAMLGDLYFQEKSFSLAISMYDKIEQSSISEKIRFNALQARFEQAEYKEVAAKGEQWLREKSGGGQEETFLKVRYLVAEAYFRQALRSVDEKEKISCLKLAKPHYRYLVQTKYGDRILFPLAEIHRLLKEDSRAVSLYQTLGEKYPEHKERFLFQAAILQIKEDKKGAIQSFKKVYELQGKRSKLAAYNLLVLYHEYREHQEYLNFYEVAATQMPEEKRPLLMFYQGQAYYALGFYKEAAFILEEMMSHLLDEREIVSWKQKYKNEQKAALLLMANCACYLKNESLIEKVSTYYKTLFPEAAEVPTLFFAQAQIYQEVGEIEKACETLGCFLVQYPKSTLREKALYELSSLLVEQKKFSRARESFILFLHSYPKSTKAATAKKWLLHCYAEEIQSKEKGAEQALGGPVDLLKKEFISFLGQVLKEDQILSNFEKEQYQFVMIQCLFELGEFSEAEPLLVEIIATSAKKETIAQAHWLLARKSKEKKEDSAYFIEHGEKALNADPTMQDAQQLHLELYNAYLLKGGVEKEPSQKQAMIAEAANHLFASNKWKNGELKQENLIWLAHYFYEKALEEEGEDLYRASLLFEKLLHIDGSKPSLSMLKEEAQLEKEVLKYGHLLSLRKRYKEQVTLLQALIEVQEKEQLVEWKFKRKTLLELALTYEALGEFNKALQLHETLAHPSLVQSSVITDTAKLHIAKLQYRMLDPFKKNTRTPEVATILGHLKELQMQKKIAAEPIYVEAALEYVEILSALMKPEEAVKKSLFFYQRMKRDFSSAEGEAEDYIKRSRRYPKKEKMLDAYMKYVTIEVLRRQALLQSQAANPEKAALYRASAHNLMNSLLEEKKLLRPYLIERVNRLKVELQRNA